MEIAISFWRAVGDARTQTETSAKQRKHLLSGPLSRAVFSQRDPLEQHSKEQLSPCQASGARSRRTEQAAAGKCHTSGTSPGDALAWAAHVLPASRQPSCSPNLSFPSLMPLQLAVFSLACRAVGMRPHYSTAQGTVCVNGHNHFVRAKNLCIRRR